MPIENLYRQQNGLASLLFKNKPNETSSLRTVGDLSLVPGNYLAPTSWTNRPTGRASLLHCLLHDGELAIFTTAAWVYFGYYHCPKLELGCFKPARRGISRNVVRYRVLYQETDITSLNGLPITTPARTGLDICYRQYPNINHGLVFALAKIAGGYEAILNLMPQHDRHRGSSEIRRILGVISRSEGGYLARQFPAWKGS